MGNPFLGGVASFSATIIGNLPGSLTIAKIMNLKHPLDKYEKPSTFRGMPLLERWPYHLTDANKMV
jgi:hypothetical protein